MPYIYKSGLQFGTGNITINQTNPIREMTQAQYDALPASEKANGTIYFITDATVDKLIIDDPAPIGAILAYGGTTAPTGWLFCQGQQVSRALYSELFAVIGTTYGSGDGSTTFNLPDFRGRTAIGEGTGTASGAVNHPLGQTEGAETIKLTDAQMAHGHGMTQPAFTIAKEGMTSTGMSTNETHVHKDGTSSTVAYGGTTGNATAQVLFDANSGRETTPASTAHTHKIPSAAYSVPRSTNAAVTDLSGASSTRTAHSNMQPYIVTNYIIKAKDQGSPNSSILAMIDFFYPVGSYYETSDTSFDPNVSWGGRWSLETEGQVHVSAGSSSSYTIGTAGGAATRSYTPAGTVNNTTLTAAQMPYHRHSVDAQNSGTADISHTHTLSNHTHVAYNSGSYVWVNSGSTHGVAAFDQTSSTGGPSNNTSGGMSAHATDHKHSVPAHNTNYAGGSNGTTQAHNHGFTGTESSINIMQPYIAVNRWHRTA